jgi:hypothetical protein
MSSISKFWIICLVLAVCGPSSVWATTCSTASLENWTDACSKTRVTDAGPTKIAQANLAALDGDSKPLLSSKELMQLARQRLQDFDQRGDSQPSHDAWDIASLLQLILDTAPKSREALIIRRGQIAGFDLFVLQELARRWALENPELVDTGIEINLVSDLNQSKDKGSETVSWFLAKPVADDQSATASELTAQTPDAASNGVAQGRLSSRDHFDFRKRTTVLVIQLAPLRNGVLQWLYHGTGSFIGPNLVLTNTHVVETDPGVLGHSFLVVNQSLGISRAVVLARGRDASKQGVDAAVLQVLDFYSPDYLQLTDQVQEGDQAVLAGYPGKLSDFDRAFLDLQSRIDSGVIPTNDSIPVPKFSSGAVQSVFTKMDTNLESLSADLEVAAGASGSALTNECGQMVALFHSATTALIDDQGYVDAAMYSFSVTSREVMKWLESARIPFERVSSPCE